MSVPELRFPEFEGEWEDKKLGECLRATVGGGTPSRKNDNYWNGKIPWASVKDFDDYKYQKSTLESITEEGLKNSSSNLIPKDNLIISTRMGLGKGFINKIPISINQDLKGLIPKKDVYVEFLYYWYKLKSKYIETLGNGSTVKGLRLEELHALMISIPTIKEQEKIASFLSAVDEKIEKLEEKQVLWESYKKGMMQKIFSQELRFKDENGEDYPDWEEKRLKDFVTIPKKEKLSNVDNETLLTVKLHCKGIEANYGIQPKITKRGRPYFKRNAGEFLIGRQNFHNGGMGIVPAELDGFISSNAITSLKINEEKVIKRYLLYYLSRRDYYKKTVVIMGGTGQKEISERNILNLDVKTPILNEQRKIAKFLLNIENKIVLLNQKLEISINFKKGLSQKMFY